MNVTLRACPCVKVWYKKGGTLIITSSPYDNHLKKVDKVLQRLSKGGLKGKHKEHTWTIFEVKYLGHWITCEGFKPMTDKVKSILGMQRPHAGE